MIAETEVMQHFESSTAQKYA